MHKKIFDEGKITKKQKQTQTELRNAIDKNNQMFSEYLGIKQQPRPCSLEHTATITVGSGYMDKILSFFGLVREKYIWSMKLETYAHIKRERVRLRGMRGYGSSTIKMEKKQHDKK